MDELAATKAFVQIARYGSLSEAARRTRLSVSTVSRYVGELEALLGVRLFNRTTRRLSLTEVGRLYFEGASRTLEELEKAKANIALYQQEARGLLRVRARTSVATEVIGPALPGFLNRYPEVSLEFTLTDQLEDLVADGIDVAIWLGDLRDSSMIARRLRVSRRRVVGSPAYFAQHGIPATPADLQGHNCLAFMLADNTVYQNSWWYKDGDHFAEVSLNSKIRLGSTRMLLDCALRGVGLILVHEAFVRKHLSDGSLVEVLADHDFSAVNGETSLYAVFPYHSRQSPKVRAFVDFLVELFPE